MASREKTRVINITISSDSDLIWIALNRYYDRFKGPVTIFFKDKPVARAHVSTHAHINPPSDSTAILCTEGPIQFSEGITLEFLLPEIDKGCVFLIEDEAENSASSAPQR